MLKPYGIQNVLLALKCFSHRHADPLSHIWHCSLTLQHQIRVPRRVLCNLKFMVWRRAQKAAARQAAALKLSLADGGAGPAAGGGARTAAAPTATASNMVAGNVACWPLRQNPETYMSQVTMPRQVYQKWNIQHATTVTLVAPTGLATASSLRINGRGEARLTMNFQRVTQEMPQARL